MTQINFPGFGTISSSESGRHVAVEGALRCDGVTLRLELLQDKEYDFLPPMLAKIKMADNRKVLWSFGHEKSAGFTGICTLANIAEDGNNTPVLVFMSRGADGRVLRAITLSNIAKETLDFDVLANLELKKKAAKALNKETEYTAEENRLIAVLTKRKHDEEAATREEEERQRAARDLQRQDRLNAILARRDVVGYTSDGAKRFGKPVVGDEWMTLPHGAFVILVDSFDQKTGEVGAFIEAFSVVKEKGKNPKRGFSKQVTREKQMKATTPNLPRKIHTAMIEKDGKFLSVDLYASKQEIDRLKDMGLNSGTLVGFQSNDPKSTTNYAEVFRLTKGKIETIGKCEVI